MLLALVVYLLAYLLLLNSLESSAESLRRFCDGIAPSASLQDISRQAEQEGMQVTLQSVPATDQRLFFIARPAETDAVCRGLAEGDQVTQRQLVLKWF